MLKKIANYLFNLRKNFYFKVESVRNTDGDLRFKIRDFGQIMPYELTPSEILDFRIINQLQPKDAYTTGCIITLNNYAKFKFNSLQISGDGKKITLRSEHGGPKDAFTGDLTELLANYECLGNCSPEVLKTLLAIAYNTGKSDGIGEMSKLEQAGKVDRPSTGSNEPTSNVVSFKQISK